MAGTPCAGRRLLPALFFSLLATYAWFCQGGGWNSNSRLALVRAIVERRTLRIDAYHQATGDKARVGDRYYTDKSPGPSFLAAPVYAAGRLLLRGPGPFAGRVDGLAYLCVLAVSALPTCLAALCLLWFVRDGLGAGPRWSMALALGYGLGTLALPYATLFYNHQLGASLACVAFCLAARPGLGGKRWTLRFGRAVVVGTLLGWAAISDYVTLAVALVVLLLLLVQTEEWFPLVPLGLAFLLPVLGFMSYNTHCFGGPLALGYRHEVSPMFAGHAAPLLGFRPPSAHVLWEIIGGAYRGLFRGSPFLVMTLPAAALGLIGLLRTRRFEEWSLGCWWIAGVVLLANCSMGNWDGGFAAGPRFLAPALPFLVLTLARLPRVLRWASAPLLLLSIGSMLATTAVNPEVPLVVRRPWGEYTLPHLAAGRLGVNRQTYQDLFFSPDRGERAAFNWGEKLGLPGVWGIAPLAGIWLVIWLWRRRER